MNVRRWQVFYFLESYYSLSCGKLLFSILKSSGNSITVSLINVVVVVLPMPYADPEKQKEALRLVQTRRRQRYSVFERAYELLVEFLGAQDQARKAELEKQLHDLITDDQVQALMSGHRGLGSEKMRDVLKRDWEFREEKAVAQNVLSKSPGIEYEVKIDQKKAPELKVKQ